MVSLSPLFPNRVSLQKRVALSCLDWWYQYIFLFLVFLVTARKRVWLSTLTTYKNSEVIETTFAILDPQSSGYMTLVKRMCVGSGRSRDAAKSRRLREHSLVRFQSKLFGPPPNTWVSHPGWWSSYRWGACLRKMEILEWIFPLDHF